MSDATIFYILGGVLAAMAVTTSLIGLRVQSFPGRYGPVVFLCFVAVVGAAITFAVRNGQHEEEARAAETEPAGEEIEEEEESPVPAEPAEEGSEEAAGEPKAKGPGGTVQLAASPTALAFDTKQLSSKPGKVTIDFDNPARARTQRRDRAGRRSDRRIRNARRRQDLGQRRPRARHLHLPLHRPRACRSGHGRHPDGR